MITLRTIAYVVGITIAISAFALFLYSFLPHLIENDQWERLGGADISEEELLKKIQAHDAYIAFYDRFPDAKEDFRYYKHRGGSGEMQVGVVNFEKNNSLTLSLNYNDRDEAIYANVRCDTNEEGYRDLRADNLFVIDFINQTNCLERESTITNTSLEQVPEHPFILGGSPACGPDTRFSDGVCVVIIPNPD